MFLKALKDWETLIYSVVKSWEEMKLPRTACEIREIVMSRGWWHSGRERKKATGRELGSQNYRKSQNCKPWDNAGFINYG